MLCTPSSAVTCCVLLRWKQHAESGPPDRARRIETVLHEMESEERLLLMRFVCSFAWADLHIHPDERQFVGQLVRRLDLDPGETRQVEQWLRVPPRPEELDPTHVPMEHRKTFVQEIVGIIESDGVVTDEERDNLALFEALLR